MNAVLGCIAVVLGMLVNMSAGASAATTQPSDAPATQPMPEILAIDTAKLRDHYGQHVVVVGEVRSAELSKSGKVFRINFNDTPDAGYMAVVFAADLKDVEAGFPGGMAKALVGKTIKVTGLVEDYRGRPETVIRSAKQIEITASDKR
jgi:DNA/RNA endonuclease YhcR with UshA esterase domain